MKATSGLAPLVDPNVRQPMGNRPGNSIPTNLERVVDMLAMFVGHREKPMLILDMPGSMSGPALDRLDLALQFPDHANQAFAAGKRGTDFPSALQLKAMYTGSGVPYPELPVRDHAFKLHDFGARGQTTEGMEVVFQDGIAMGVVPFETIRARATRDTVEPDQSGFYLGGTKL